MGVKKLLSKVTENQLVIALVVLAVGMRLIPHPANFAPIGAIALFGGVYLKKKQALWLPLVAMIISDLFIGLHSTVAFTWGSFLLIALIGIAISKKKNIGNVVFGTISGSLLFFFVTNFGVWAVTPWYSKTWVGILECYTLAIPFFRNTFVSDLFFVGALFGAYELSRKYLASSTTQKAEV